MIDRREIAAAIAVGLAAVAMLAGTWKTWPDPVVDSGRELYVAWQLSEGRALYRDVAYFNGPLSPALNAAWFTLTGPGIAKLEALNGAVLLAIAACVYGLTRRVAGWPAAAASTLVLVTVFAFGPQTTHGSFTYLLPYSHEMTHGLLLLGILLAAILHLAEEAGPAAAWVAGGAFGLTLLTKPEFMIAAGMAAACGLALTIRGSDTGRRRAIIGRFTLAAAAPPAVTSAVLLAHMPARVALDGLAGSWEHLTDPALTSMPYFKIFSGFDRPLAALGLMLVASAAWAVVFGAALLAGRLVRVRGFVEAAIAIACAAAVGGAFIYAREIIPWRHAFRPLPVVAALALCGSLVALRKVRSDVPARARLVLLVASSAAALGLTAKMILFARVWHYGFALGMPATMLSVAALAGGTPALARRSGGSALVAGGVVAGVLAGVIAGHLAVMSPILRERSVPLGRGADAFLADARGLVMGQALETVERLAPPGASLAVLPDGVMLSYLARRPNSTPYIIGNPVDVTVFGENRMLAAYRASPPDFVAIFRCDTAIYGFPGFGQGYAERLLGWIAAHYDRVEVVRDDDPRNSEFRGVLMTRRNKISASAEP